MEQTSRNLVQRLWACGNYLKDDGVASTDFLAQLSMLLFLKLSHEHERGEISPLSVGYLWPSLLKQTDSLLLSSYAEALEALGLRPGMVGAIFQHTSQKIRQPSTLRRLLAEIDAIQWATLDGDLLAGVYEEIVGKVAEESKSGAGQFFTPRPLIEAIVEVMRPVPGERICDPACGTGGFLVAARRYLLDYCSCSDEQIQAVQRTTFSGNEIVHDTARLCIMNLLLHGIGDESGECPITIADSLLSAPRDKVDIVFCNPPYGTQRGGQEALVHHRNDFPFVTANKQLNFLQHVVALLNENGRAAVVVPDNVLFGGGIGENIRRWLLQVCDVHTLLRLPTGIFYAQGVKTNVLFLQKRAPRFQPWTTRLWVYDLRTNSHYTLRTKALTRTDLDDFVQSYHSEDLTQRQENDRFQCYTYEDLIQREKCNLDILCVGRKACNTVVKSDSVVRDKQEMRDLPLDPERAKEVIQSFRRMFPKGSRIYVSVASEIPLLVKFYAAYGQAIISLDLMLSRFMPGFCLERSKFVSGMFAPDKGILHDDTDTVLFMVDDIGEYVWQDRDAYHRDWLPE